MNQLTNQKQKFSVVIKSDAYQKIINDTLGDPEVSRKFVAEISTLVANNPKLQTCDSATILSSGLLAQSLNLPLAPTLGFAYVIPYGNKAQFQIGWKGLVQLCQRSGQFQTIGVREVHEGEYAGQDEFGDDKFAFSHDCDAKKVVGYFAYFKLINGFTKTIYWTKDQCNAHALKHSSAYKAGRDTKWNDEFDSMAKKTVLKQLLSKWAPMSVEQLHTAIQADQAVISNGKYEYVDNEQEAKKPNAVANNLAPNEYGEVAESVVESEEDNPF